MSDSVGSYVRGDEKLLWKGRPQQGLRLYSQDMYIAPFSLLWAGGVVSIFTLGGPGFGAGPFPFSLFSLFFGVLAVYVTIGRLLHDAWIRSGTEYAVTDRRVLILHHSFTSDLTTVEIGNVDQVRIRSRGGRGDIIFGRDPELAGLFGSRSFRAAMALWVPAMSETPQLIGVENARRLFDQIEGLRAQARR